MRVVRGLPLAQTRSFLAAAPTMNLRHLSIRLIALLAMSFAPARADVWEWLNPELRSTRAEIAELQQRLQRLAPLPTLQSIEHAGFHSGIAGAQGSARWVQIDLGAKCPIESVIIVPAFSNGIVGYGFPLRFRIDVSDDAAFGESTTLLDATGEDRPASALPVFAASSVAARYVRFTATKLFEQPRLRGGYICCLGEMLVFSEGRNVALHRKVIAPSTAETLPTWSAKYLVDGWTALGLPIEGRELIRNGWHSAIARTADEVKWVQVDLGKSVELQEIRLIPARPPDFPDRLGFGFPRRFKIEASDRADFPEPRVVFDATNEDFPNPGDNPFAVSLADVSARFIRVTATRLWERTNDFVFALAELQAWSNGSNVALGAAVSDFDQTQSGRWSRAFLVDDRTSAGALLDEQSWLRELASRSELETQIAVVEGRETGARAIAIRRAAWAGAAVLIVFLGAGVGLAMRARRLRVRELEALRQQISRDLHDELGSHLGSIRLMSELALRETSDAPSRENLSEIHRLSGEAAESMRGIIWLVRAGESPRLTNLVEAIRQSAATLLKGLEWHVELESGATDARAPLEFHRHVFLIFREVAHNIARHSGATRVQSKISWQSGHFTLCVEDDGCGFDPSVASGGSGLANLRHRAATLHGTLEIVSRPGEGTSVKLAAPF